MVKSWSCLSLVVREIKVIWSRYGIGGVGSLNGEDLGFAISGRRTRRDSRAFGIGGAERVKVWDLLSRAEALRVTQRALWHWWAEDGVDSGSRGQPARRICGNLRLTCLQSVDFDGEDGYRP